MISKQLKIIICCAIAVLILAGSLVLVKVLTKSDTVKEKIELLDGEAEGTSDKPRIIEQLDSKDIYSIAIHNSNGDFKLIHNLKDDITYLDGYEEYPIDTSMIETLYSRVSGFIVSRVEVEPKNIADYGLDDKSSPAYLEIEKFDKKIYKLYFGLKSADGKSYYMMCDGRNVVYSVANSSIDDVIMVPVEKYISPIAANYIDNIDYVNISSLSIKHNGKDFISFEMVSDEYREKTGYTLTHQMIYPTNYQIDVDKFEKLLSSFAKLDGTEVIGFGYEKRDEFSKLDDYGFDKNVVTIEYVYKDVTTVLYVGGKTEDGSGYYVYTLLYDTLIIIPDESLPFIDWQLGDYISKPLFRMSINNVDKIEVISKGLSAEFTLKGVDKELEVFCNGKKLSEDENGDPNNFRQYYKHLIRLPWDGYAEKPDKTDNPYLTVKITTRFGETYEYKFYQTSELRCFMTYNGDGEFYTEKATLDEFISNTVKVMNNETVIA